MEELRALLGVDRIHATKLGMGGLVRISKNLEFLQRHLDFRFDFYLVRKLDHAAICFFDQVFDQGMNPAVTWTGYWTPLRYIMLLKVSRLFDLEVLKKAWNARIQSDGERGTAELVEVCQTLLSRVHHIVDIRSRQIITDALTWASNNPKEIQYNCENKRDFHRVTPNLVGFQTVMQGIALRIKNGTSEPLVIVVDQQSQFNKTQRSLAEFYAGVSGFRYDFGTGLPEIDFTGMPNVPILFKSGRESVGLELVDVYLWLFKRMYEGKEIPPELHPIIGYQLGSIITNEISLNAIEERWSEWFENLPVLTADQIETAKKMISIDEQRRQSAISIDKQQKKLSASLE